jgi:hypothetical protein
VDHVTFTPGSDTAAATPAPGAAFWTAAARVGVETELRSWRALRVLLGLSCDVILADVHYDVRDDAGHMRRYFVPFAVRPALSVGLAWRF